MPLVYPAATAHYTVCGDGSDATYAYTLLTNGDYEDLYNLADHTTETGTISNVAISIRGKYVSHGANDVAAYRHVKTHSIDYTPGSNFGLLNLSTSISTDTYNSATNPNTSAAWTWAEIDALQVGYDVFDDTALSDAYINDVWVDVTYSASASLTVSDTMHAHDALGVIAYKGVADAVHAKDALGAIVYKGVADVVKLYDALATFWGYVVSVADVVHMHDAVSTWLADAFADVVHTHDALAKLVSTAFSDTIKLAESWVSKVYSSLADVVHLHDAFEGHSFTSLVVSDIIHLRDCVTRWRWLTAIRNLGRGRCPQAPVRTDKNIHDGLTG
jgi:hypothetical protein